MLKYELRIKLMETDYEVFRDAVIPAGITFSQFAVLINCILNYKEVSRFNFSINDSLIIDEHGNIDLAKKCELKLIDANTAYIQDYLHEKDDIVYFVDGYFHQIEIKNITECEISEISHAEVKESKGVFPTIPEEPVDPEVTLAYLYCTYCCENSSACLETMGELDSSIPDNNEIKEIQDTLTHHYKYRYGSPDNSCIDNIEKNISKGLGIQACK